MLWSFARKYLLNSEFEELFFRNELKSLNSKSSNGLWKLFLITLITFLSLGVAIGSLMYLEARMDNPLINLLSISPNTENYSLSKDYTAYDLKEKIAINDIRTKYNIQELNEYGAGIMDFFHSSGESYYGYLRTLTYKDNRTLLDYLLKDKNIRYKKPISDNEFIELFDEGQGIIVTEQFVKDLGYNYPEDQRRLQIKASNNGIDYPVFKEVLAVVKEIPSPQGLTLDLICSNKLFINYEDTQGKNIETGNNHLPVVTTLSDQLLIKSVLKKQFKDYDFEIDKQIFVIINKEENFSYLIKDKQGLSIDKQGILKSLNDLDENHSFEILYKWNISEYANAELPDPEYLSLIFSNWEKVREFSSYLRDKYTIKLNMTQVEEKENFTFISHLTEIISFILFLFGLISILIYVVSLINNHIRENRATLGTFKAFGLPNDFLNRLYSKIIFSFLALVLIPTLIIGAVLHIIMNFMFKEDSFFYFLHPYILIASILFVGITYGYIRWFGINRILEKTPGDLIYKRD